MSGSFARGLTRKEALAAGLAAGGATAGGLLLGGPSPAGSQGTSSDADAALNAILRIERVQAGFYADAVAGGALTGEMATFARTLADQEREHVAALTDVLGGAAERAPRMQFGRTTRDPDEFSRAARELEDLAAQSYGVEALALSGRALREVLRIISVESRHAAWIRDLRGEDPAPDAVEPGASGEEARATLDRMGFLR
jgi:hypothetical protein